jgi:hypothetical protein
MIFIEEKLFQDKRMNLTVYEKIALEFICMELSWLLLNGNFQDKRTNLTVYKK